MNLIRSGMKAPIATEWVTAPDVIAQGTDAVGSTEMLLHFNNLPDFFKLLIDVRFDMQATSLESHYMEAWLRLGVSDAEIVSTDGDTFGYSYTRKIAANTIKQSRRILIDRPVIQSCYGVGLPDWQSVMVRSVGSVEIAEYAITNIKSRLIYFPL